MALHGRLFHVLQNIIFSSEMQVLFRACRHSLNCANLLSKVISNKLIRINVDSGIAVAVAEVLWRTR